MKKISAKWCLLATLIFLSALWVTSCKNSSDKILDNKVEINSTRKSIDESLLVDETIEGDYQIIQDIVHFKNPDTYHKYKVNLQKSADEFEKLNPNFESLHKKMRNAIKEVEMSSSAEELEKVKEKQADFLFIKEDVIYPKMTDIATKFMNKDGAYFIGKILYVFTRDYQYIIFDGDMNKISDIKKDIFDVNLVSKSTYRKSFQNAQNARIKVNGCKWLGGAQNNSSNNRRVEANCWASLNDVYVGNDPVTGEQIRRVYFDVTTEGIPLKKSFGNWITYSTYNNLYVNYLARFSVNGTLELTSNPNFQKTSNYDYISDNNAIGSELVPISLMNTITYGVEFESNGSYSSGGVAYPGAIYNNCFQN